MQKSISKDIASNLDKVYQKENIREQNSKDIAMIIALAETYRKEFEEESRKILEFNNRNGISKSTRLNENLGWDLFFGIGGAIPWVGAPISAAGAGYYIKQYQETDGFDKTMNMIMAVLSIFQAIGSLMAVGGVAVGAAKGVLLGIRTAAAGLSAGANATRAQRLAISSLRSGRLSGPAQGLIRQLNGMSGKVADNFISASPGAATRASTQIETFLGVGTDDAIRISNRMGNQWSSGVMSIDDLVKGVRSGRGRLISPRLTDDASEIAYAGMVGNPSLRTVPLGPRPPMFGARGSARLNSAAAGLQTWAASSNTARMFGRIFGTAGSPTRIGGLNMSSRLKSGQSALKPAERLTRIDDAVGVGINARPGVAPSASSTFSFTSPTLAAASKKPPGHVFTTNLGSLPRATMDDMVARASGMEPYLGAHMGGIFRAATNKAFPLPRNFGQLGLLGKGQVVGGAVTAATGIGAGAMDLAGDAADATGIGGELTPAEQEALFDEMYGSSSALPEPQEYEVRSNNMVAGN